MHFQREYLPSTHSPDGYLCGHGVFLCYGARVFPEKSIPPSLTFGIFCQVYDFVVNLLFKLYSYMVKQQQSAYSSNERMPCSGVWLTRQCCTQYSSCYKNQHNIFNAVLAHLSDKPYQFRCLRYRAVNIVNDSSITGFFGNLVKFSGQTIS